MKNSASAIAVSRELQAVAQVLDEELARIAGTRVAFTLLVFTEGRANYISNADRAESVAQLRDLLTYWESGIPDIPAHEVQG